MGRRTVIRSAGLRALRTVMGLACATGLLLPASGQGLFEELLALQSDGQVTRALATAEACVEPLERAQARLFVLHHAGDLAGSLAAGLEGLRIAPSDPWLLERSTSLALDLGAGDVAQRLLPRLELALADQGLVESWEPKVQELISRTAAASAQRQTIGASLKRAQGIAAGAGLLALCCLALAGRGGRGAGRGVKNPG